MTPFGADPVAAKSVSRRARVAAACALVAVGLCLYARTLGYEFLDWDDIEQVVENPWIRSLSLAHLASIFSQPVVGSFFPLQSLTFLLDYALWGLDPRGFHATSVLLNALNGVLAFWVIARLTRRPALAFIAALLWSVHHSHVEAVAWVSARKEVLSTALLLFSFGTYLRARRSSVLDRRYYGASVVLFGLAAAAKLTIGSYVLFFLLADWFEDARLAPHERPSLRRRVSNKLPYVAVALPFALMNLWVQPVAGLGVEGPFDYVLVRGQAAWRYLWLLLGLLPGQPLYDPPPISYDPRLAAATLLPLIAPPVAFAFALRRGYTNVVFGLGWLMIGLAAPLAFPLVTYMADRYLYLPSLGFAWLLGAGIAKLAFVENRSRVWNAAVALIATAAPVAWYAQRTWLYTPTWQNSESLWTRAVATAHRDDRPATALSKLLIRQGRIDEAERVLTQPDALGPIGYLHLAIVYHEQGRIGDALRATDQALAAARLRPPLRKDAAKLMHLRGLLLAKQNRLAEAVEAWKAALALDPDHVAARAALDAVERGGE